LGRHLLADGEHSFQFWYNFEKYLLLWEQFLLEVFLWLLEWQVFLLWDWEHYFVPFLPF
jgi:hypothetical protein